MSGEWGDGAVSRRARTHRPPSHAILSRPLALVLTVGPAAVFGACGESRSSSAAAVRDSAGITIVENPDVAVNRSPLWVVRDTPELEIGAPQGDEEYQLFQVRGALRLADGRIVIANAGTHELRFFAPDGRFLHAVGREGSGPGEFQRMGGLHLVAGDTLETYDSGLQRISLFDLEGRFLRSVQVEVPGGQFAFARQPFADGSWLVSTGSMFTSGGPTSGALRDTVTYYRVSTDGTLLDTLGTFPGDEYFMRSSGNRMTVTGLPFGLGEASAVGGDRFYFGNTDRYEIGRYTIGGRLELLLRKHHRRLPVTDRDIADNLEERLESADDNWRRELRRMHADMPFPSAMPAFSSFRVDDAGNLWVADSRRPSNDQPRWLVFDTAGVLLGPVETPPGFGVRQIGRDFVLGTRRDQMDIEYVRLYALLKPEQDR